MKILVWNLQNFGTDKYANSLFRLNTWGLGNTVSDFIAKVVSCSPAWDNIPFLCDPAPTQVEPIDIFVIIEAFHGGAHPQHPVSTTYNTFLAQIVSDLNLAVSANSSKAAATSHPYTYYAGSKPPEYAAVPGIVSDSPGANDVILTTSSHTGETVGFIYNKNAVKYHAANSGLVENFFPNPGSYEFDRIPFFMNFTSLDGASTYNIVANHAPPPGKSGGSKEKKFKDPIYHSNNLYGCVAAPGLPPTVPHSTSPQLLYYTPNTYIVGDFNCCINDTYTKNASTIIKPFQGLYALSGNPAQIPTSPLPTIPFNYDSSAQGKLSSVKTALSADAPAKAPLGGYPEKYYLSMAYDDILFNTGGVRGVILNLIEKARDFSQAHAPLINDMDATDTEVGELIKDYRIISDHLPVLIEC